MKKLSCLLAGIIGMAAWSVPARANFILFEAHLDGAQDKVATTATGFGTVVLNDVADTITVDESWVGLIGGPATASHIHGPAAPGFNAPVLFPFSGVPGVVSGSIPEQVFSITPTQIGDLEAGLYYFNVHDAGFPGGEIRGQILRAPDDGPGMFAVVAAVVICLLVRDRRRSAAAA